MTSLTPGKYKFLIWPMLILVIFSIGYYLRAYNSIYHDLPYSPYEAFEVNSSLYDASKGEVVHFTDQIPKYPTKIVVGKLFNKLFGDFYILYLLGFIAIFLLGQELTLSKLGGFLAVLLYAVSPENLLHYTKTILINDSGLCYIMTWFAILFLTKFIKTKKNVWIVLFLAAALVALTSYHTGATALIVLLFGFSVSLFYAKQFDKKIFLSFIFLFLFYLAWIISFDPSQIIADKDINQLSTVKNAILDINWVFVILIGLVGSGIYFFRKAFIHFINIRDIVWIKTRLTSLRLGYFGVGIMFIAAILIFSKVYWFDFLLALGVDNYYISAITLNNYFAQIILTHWYSVFLLPILFKRDLGVNEIIKRGWLLGIIIIGLGLASQSYYSRIPDYSFPLAFILFAGYWVVEKEFRKTIVVGTFVLLVISQLVIFNDPFSMRRYYNQNEIDSTQAIISLDLKGDFRSDLRTSALFRYLGKGDVRFFTSSGKKHKLTFYEYEQTKESDLQNDTYVVLSESMRHIVYAANFQTKPVDNDLFFYYEENFKKVYDDGLMKVYNIRNLK